MVVGILQQRKIYDWQIAEISAALYLKQKRGKAKPYIKLQAAVLTAIVKPMAVYLTLMVLDLI